MFFLYRSESGEKFPWLFNPNNSITIPIQKNNKPLSVNEINIIKKRKEFIDVKISIGKGLSYNFREKKGLTLTWDEEQHWLLIPIILKKQIKICEKLLKN